MRRFLAILAARNKEFMRDRAALAWNFIFPVFIVAGFAFAFAGDAPDRYKVGVVGAVPAQQEASLEFLRTRYLQLIPIGALSGAVTKIERHQLDMLIDPGERRYWINESSPNGYVLERVLWGSGGSDFRKQTVSGAAVRYVDWVLPGVLAMNMMFSALYGVGFVIVRYRKNGVLKRLKATPLSAFEFLAAQLLSRLWLIVAVAILVYAGTDVFIHFRMYGSYLDLLLVFTLGSTSLIGMGLIIAARTASEEFASGIVNVVGWPMMFLSGVWFSLEGLHPWIQNLALIFPLTHLIDAARAIMLEGAGLTDVATQVAVLAAMAAAFLAFGAWSFRWEQR